MLKTKSFWVAVAALTCLTAAPPSAARDLARSFLPDSAAPSAKLPSATLPSAKLPSGDLADDRLPASALPDGALPSGVYPKKRLPSATLPPTITFIDRRDLALTHDQSHVKRRAAFQRIIYPRHRRLLTMSR